MKKAKRKPQVAYPHAVIRPMEVENPHYSNAHEGSKGNPRKITAMVNIRESAVGTMAARGLLDAPQIMAADRFRRLFEAAGGAGARAIDYGREPVDGGGMYDPIPDRVVDASKELAACVPILGHRTYKIIEMVVGEGCQIRDIEREHRARTTLADYIKHGLDDLAEHWNFRTRKTPSHSQNLAD